MTIDIETIRTDCALVAQAAIATAACVAERAAAYAASVADRPLELDGVEPPQPPEPLRPPPPAMARILLRKRALNARGRGSEEYRLIVERDRLRWANDVAERVEGDWYAPGIRAHERHCSQHGRVPVGAIVIAIDKEIGSGKSTPRYTAGVVVARWSDEKGKWITSIEWDGRAKHIRATREGGSYAHTIEVDGVRRTVRS